jgi:Fe-S-cluster containining protein
MELKQRPTLWEFFKCRRCGKCCEQLGLPWYADDIERIAEFLKIKEEEVVRKYYGDIYFENGKRLVRMDEKRRKPCPFLGADKLCKIYPVRPYGCKAYPIETDCGCNGVDCPAKRIVDELTNPKDVEDFIADRLFLLSHPPVEGPFPYPAEAWICIGGAFTRPELFGHVHLALTGSCTCYQEVEYSVKYLKKVFEECFERILKEAKQLFGFVTQ